MVSIAVQGITCEYQNIPILHKLANNSKVIYVSLKVMSFHK